MSFGVPAGHDLQGVRSVLQEFLLEVDDGAQHGFVLDFCWWDDDAAVNEFY